MRNKPRFFFGWIIIGVSVVIMTLIYGMRHSFSLFFPPILDEFAWARGSTAFMLSLNLLVYGFAAPFAGSLADRWNPRHVMLMGIIIVSMSIAMCAFADKLWHFYVLFGVLVPVGSACSGWPIVSPTLANWFTKKRGLAMGVGQVGGGLSFTFGMYAEFVISQFGWRHAYFVLAGTVAILLVPLYLLFFYHRPEDKGLKPYGTDEVTPKQLDNGGRNALQDWTLGRAIKTYRLWLLAISFALFWGFSCYLVLAHQVQFTEDVGYTATFAAYIFALFGIFQATGQALSGISDWFGREKVITVAVALTVGALTALILLKDTSQAWLLYIYATSFGLGAGLFAPTLFTGAADIFHGRHFGAITGLILTGLGVGGVIGPWVGGYIYDVTGSYLSAFYLCIASSLITCILFWTAAPRKEAR